ncbi:hypothetical protein QBC46DRAFT_338686 [Diplogelasinospora grovesii]|uniref:F-box domain-containing protein n=1 Tax=Diplogelasinospora grovesii TaxID=303347 RepID=A0AAN6NFY7_9PEZI|nr:hypothetical protein QBC46DRAFT_338686 [Diplogelasinospora grovesii]
MAGSDIGSIICFEIIDGYFYGLSNQTSFERRQNTEGVIDDRWTSVRMFKDETTGVLKVVESRKEWPAGHGSARRTYYTTEISFSGALREHEWDEDDGDEDDGDEDDGDDQIRIRGSSRRPWSPDELQKRRRLSPAQRRDSESALEQVIHDIYKHEDVVLWPPEQDPARWDPALDELYTLLSPPSHRGNVHGTWDDRCLVYATGGTTDRLKAIIFVSFDPTIRLMGARPYSGRLIRGRPAGILHCGPRASSELH